MNVMSRRKALQMRALGAGALITTGLLGNKAMTVSANNAAEEPMLDSNTVAINNNSATVTEAMSLFMQPEMSSIISPSTNLVSTDSNSLELSDLNLVSQYPWAVSNLSSTEVQAAETDVMNLKFAPTHQELATWMEQFSEDCECDGIISSSRQSQILTANSSLDAILASTVNGMPDMSLLGSAALSSVLDSNQLDLSIDMYHAPEFGHVSETNRANSVYLPFIASPPTSIQAAGVSAMPNLGEAIDGRWYRDLWGWKLQLRGPDNHPLGSCVRQNVKHYNIEIFKRQSNGRYGRALINAHIGTYRSGGRRCFVLYNSSPRACWKICSPSRAQLATMLRWTLYVAAAAAGVALAWWLIASLAAAGSSAMYLPILALA